ncbi:hypothetical protein BD410DRAFT_714188 [Rickenella mellea]|uniref:Phosphatidylinositol N-acetylglucosaminyltransferase subunit H conserved domain-containing protein n=1 Tax=Rickenella mellea TaxID=50990 RepID=A0A4Y7QJ11_9AGAM|nr:hypothetical protein BD410DRAFT_714188 [Rickenella mellea]
MVTCRLMRQLRDHPELRIITFNGWTEYRVENWHLSHDGKRREVRYDSWSWFDASFCCIYIFGKSTTVLWGMNSIVSRCSGIYRLTESVIAVYPHGVQFETQRGLPMLPLFASKKFIPMKDIQDIIINEGLRRWDVKFYLALLVHPLDGESQLHIAYENILPHFSVLFEIYHNLRETVTQPIEPPSAYVQK